MTTSPQNTMSLLWSLKSLKGDFNGVTGSKANIIASESCAETNDVSQKIYFVFKEGTGEPFLMRQDMTDEEFKSLEMGIQKAK